MLEFTKWLEKNGFDKTIYDYQSEWLDEQLNIKNKNFDESSPDENDLKKQKGKSINPLDIQVGDTIRYMNEEYVITDYISREHGEDQRNKMQEPNTLVYKVFNCTTEQMEELRINIEDDVDTLKNKNDLYHIVYTKPKLIDGEKVIEEHDLVMQARTKKEVEERMEEKGAKVKVVRIDKLIHIKVNKEK